jgi:hypothetical protein
LKRVARCIGKAVGSIIKETIMDWIYRKFQQKIMS